MNLANKWERSYDQQSYSLLAIKKAAYRFTDKFHISISSSSESIIVAFSPIQGLENVEYWLGEFDNEVLDQDLRVIIAKETESIGHLLLAQAFSATSLIALEGDINDYHSAPEIQGGV